MECTDSDALNAAAKHLQNAITAMKALQQNAQVKQILSIKRVFVANQNHEKQKHFFSTKKTAHGWCTQIHNEVGFSYLSVKFLCIQYLKINSS